ncbi:MAG: NAD(P)(+) transhydrogenase (Re/Si-specific) subunit alpha [Planctomycetota bacterium]|nr:MAG: NAD(P)(+) transhydrogenase (Re/Si-specific) subunit alpha [Planctomycetota bacterium]
MVLVFIPREGEAGETRVAATPETVKGLIKAGATVSVESGAGEPAGFPDADYREAGAELGEAKWGEADLVLGIRPPAPEQCSSMKQGASLVCGMQPQLCPDQVKACRDAQVTLFAMDVIPRISRAQSMDVLSSQATVAGYVAVLLGALEMPSFMPQFMTAAGTIRPAKVLILGAGVAGLQAIATARRLGAQVEANDIRPEVKEQVESLGAKFVETVKQDSSEDSGGYAKESSEESLQEQRRILSEHIAAASLVVTTALIPGRPAPKLITTEMRKDMRAGGVIVDLAAPMGGNVEGSVVGETVEDNGVKIIGPSNLPAQLPRDASQMFARNIFSLLKLMLREQSWDPDWEDEIVKACCITKDGEIKHEATKEAIG